MRVIFFIFLIAGFFYRLWLVSLFPHEIIADQKTYLQLAHEIKERFFVAECCTRGYVYPMFLAGIFEVFGTDNFGAVYIVQSAMDTITGLLIFFISKKVFNNLKWAWVSFLIYNFNPLTSSYASFLLTEIAAFFLATLILYLFLRGGARFFTGIFMGFFMFNRLMFVYWGVGFVALLAIYNCMTRFMRKISLIILLLGILSTVIYPSYANWLTYRTISPLPVLPAGRYDYVVSYRVDRWPILLDEYYKDLDPLLQREFQIDFNNRREFIKETDRWMRLVHDQVLADPVAFLRQRAKHILYFWDKSSLCCYIDPFFPADRPIIRFGNIVYLALSAIGIVVCFMWKKKTREQNFTLFYILILVGYLTAGLLVRVPEERHTMPAYPILLLFFPIGISQAINFIKNLTIISKSVNTNLP